jgi:hypothetical protein
VARSAPQNAQRTGRAVATGGVIGMNGRMHVGIVVAVVSRSLVCRLCGRRRETRVARAVASRRAWLAPAPSSGVGHASPGRRLFVDCRGELARSRPAYERCVVARVAWESRLNVGRLRQGHRCGARRLVAHGLAKLRSRAASAGVAWVSFVRRLPAGSAWAGRRATPLRSSSPRRAPAACRRGPRRQ